MSQEQKHHNSQSAYVASFIEEHTRERILPNGLRVIAVQTGMAPRVMLKLAYSVGSAYEQPGERGLAHLLEHMIFKGTALPDGTVQMSETDVAEIARTYGANTNAYTSYDVTAYYFALDSRNWKEMLPVLADCMAHARFDDEHLASEIKAVVNELRMGRDNVMRSALALAVSDLLEQNHPYSAPVIGYIEDLTSLTGARLRAFYEKNYCPSKAALLVIGDIDLDDALDAGEKALASLPRRVLAPVSPVVPLPSKNVLSPLIRIFPREVAQEQLLYVWRIPGARDVRAAVTGGLLSFALGGRKTSRLAQRLIASEQCAYSVNTFTYELALTDFLFIIITPIDGQADRCRELVFEEITRLMEHGVTPDEQVAYSAQYAQRLVSMLQSPDSYAGTLASQFVLGRGGLGAVAALRAIDTLTSDEVAAYAQVFLRSDASCFVHILPLAPAQRPLWQDHIALSEQEYTHLLSLYSRTAPLEQPRKALTLRAPRPLNVRIPHPTTVCDLSQRMTAIIREEWSVPQVSVVATLRSSEFISGVEYACSAILSFMFAERLNPAERAAIHEPFEAVGAQFHAGLTGWVLVSMPLEYRSLLAHVANIYRTPQWDEALFEYCKNKLRNLYGQMSTQLPLRGGMDVRSLLYGESHPYGRSFAAAVEAAERVTLADVQAFYRTYIVGQEWVFSVVGAIDVAEATKALEDMWKWCAATGTYQRKTIPALSETHVVRSIDIPMLTDQVFVGYAAPIGHTATLRERCAAYLATIICFEGLGARMFRVREETGLFYGVQGNFLFEASRGQYGMTISALLTKENVQPFEEVMYQLLARWQREGVSEAELISARQTALTNQLQVLSSQVALASYYLQTIYLADRSWGYIDDMFDTLATITADEVATHLAKALPHGTLARVRVGMSA